MISAALCALSLAGPAPIAPPEGSAATTSLGTLSPAPPPFGELQTPSLPLPSAELIHDGVRLWTHTTPEAGMVHLELSLRWGGREGDQDEAVFAMLARPTLYSGSWRTSGAALSRRLSQLGADWELDLTSKRWLARAQVLPGYEQEALEVLLDVLLRPRLPLREVQASAHSWSSWLHEGSASLERAHRRALNHAWYPAGHPLRYSLRPDELLEPSVRELRSWYDSMAESGEILLITTGPSLDLPALRQTLSTITPRAPSPVLTVGHPPPEERLWLVDYPRSDQALVTVCRPAPAPLAPDRAAYELLLGYLVREYSSRIIMDLREERGWTYGVHHRWTDHPEGSRSCIELQVPAEHAAASLVAVHEHYEEAVSRLADPSELQRSLAGLLSDASELALSASGLAGLWTELWLSSRSPETEQEFYDSLSKVTAEEARQAAEDWQLPTVSVITGAAKRISPQLREQATEVTRRVSAKRLALEP